MAARMDKDTLQAALPDLSGTLTLDGLQEPVDIHRDAYGIPHVRARTMSDAFFAQGFVHAQDRLWQMEWDRRRAYGRTAEVVGTPGLTNDRFVRRAILGDSAQADYDHVNAETRAMLDSYAAGVNAFINSTPTLPIEFSIAGIAPEPWQPWDGCAIYKVRHILMGSGMGKLWRARLLLAFGPQIAARTRSGASGPDQVLIVPPGGEQIDALRDMAEFQPGIDALSSLFDLEAGSNNWAVHGSRTASGLPLMAGDPHRALDVPSVYYQNHIACPEFDVVGLSFTGIPGFPHFGHNEHVAWCITHAAADYQDLYVEKFDRLEPTRYQFQGDWRDAYHRTETIDVRDADPVEVDITVTHHGPVVIGDPSTGHAISMRYTATSEPNECFHALIPMLQASTVAEFDEAMRPWVDPCNNLIITDREGTIGYLTRGQIPVRNAANAWLPVPGWTGEHEWDGVVPFEELPRLRNPDTGYIVTANNRIAGQEYPHYIGIDFAPPGRAQRILARLDELTSATADDMASVHADRQSLPSRFFVERVTRLPLDDQHEQAMLDRVSDWDGRMDADSTGALIYAAIRDGLVGVVMDQVPVKSMHKSPFSGEPATGTTLGTVLWWLIPALMRDDDTTLLNDGITWDIALTEAVRRALQRLTEIAGPDSDSWRWGDVHRTAPAHPLTAAYPEFQDALNPPAAPTGGDTDTPQAAAFQPGNNFNVSVMSVARYVFDLADWNNCHWIVPLGASGHPASPHWADQVEKWSQVELVPMLYDWDEITTAAETSQRLESPSPPPPLASS